MNKYDASDIAVIIPAYNCENTIVKTLESIHNQHLLPSEVIIVDDGSNDGTQELINSIVSEFNKFEIKLIRIENGGPSKARNHAIQVCTKKLIAFCDADDVWICPEKLTKQLEKFNEQDDLVLCDTHAMVEWPHLQKVRRLVRNNDDTSFVDFLYSNVINATSSVMVKQEVLVACGLFDIQIKFGEDRLLWANLSLVGKLGTVKSVCVQKVNTPNNLTSKIKSNFKFRRVLVDKLLKIAESNDFDFDHENVWRANVIDSLRGTFKNNYVEEFKAVYKFLNTKLTLRKQVFTKYFYIYKYVCIFGTFKPINYFFR